EKKALFVFLILLILTAATLLISAGLGQRFISPWQVAKTLFGAGTTLDEMIVQSFRMPRILVALVAGICLAVAGAILQGLVRNPLASPDIIGITGGAAVAVMLFLLLFSDSNDSLTVSLSWLPVAAFIGAALVGLIIY
ncbi:iron chelate uptake ABC transporter family permease subunit, partial [Bacillus atrophaeus]